MTASIERTPVDVAVGVLIERDAAGREGRFLLTSRPEGKVYAGYWEFPGGKLEAGETVHDALARELHEELGITIGASHPWKDLVMDYPHARVRLHFRKVFDWRGDLEMREGQAMAWESLPVASRPVLPGTVPVLEWFAAERGHAGATHSA
ncbi:MAG: NUDIX domain-containing protein [Vitreoscilla sp.]|nr:NUDIX domain-containing protein [Vitreoscilla sp.]